VEAVNRRLIRPPLNEIKEQQAGKQRNPNQKKAVPPDTTNAENYYYVKQMQTKTLMVIVFKDGETISGNIEWYDKNCLKINRDGAPTFSSISRTSSTCTKRNLAPEHGQPVSASRVYRFPVSSSAAHRLPCSGAFLRWSPGDHRGHLDRRPALSMAT
jgi:hypothetical protein